MVASCQAVAVAKVSATQSAVEPGGVGLVVGVDVLGAALVLGEDLQRALGTGRGLLVAAVGVIDRDLAVVGAVGDQIGHGDLLDDPVGVLEHHCPSAAGAGVRSASEIALAPPWAVWPPSTGISAPVMNAAASDSRKATRAATSSGCPGRPSGVSATVARRNASDAEAVIGVWMKPGWMVLTRIREGPSSIAATWARPRRAHLLAV